MNVLVTGGGGFIGFEVAKLLKSRGNEVIILDKAPDMGKWKKAREMNIKRIHANTCAINIILETLEISKDLDAIVHCAGQTAVTHSLKNPTLDFLDNARGTFEVCEFARAFDLDLIFTSTNKVYGEHPNAQFLSEDETRYNGLATSEKMSIDNTAHSPYGCSKLAADLYVQDYHNTYDLNTAVYRMSCIYGETQNGTEDQGWVYHIANQIVNEEEVKIFGNGKQVRDILHVDDLALLMLKTLHNMKSGIYNVGGGIKNTTSIIELIHAIEPDYENITYHPWREADQKYYVSDISKVSKTFNWEPTISREVGLTRLVNTLKMNKYGEN